MPCASRTGFTPNLVVGIAITAAGGVLLLDRLQLMEARDALRFWPVLLILFGASVISQALSGGLPAAAESRQRPIIGPGLVILVVFASLMLANGWRGGWPDRQGQNVFAVMGNTTRTTEGEPFDVIPGNGTEWKLAADLGRKFAAVSGDYNPIHLYAVTAKAFGFPSQIAHGIWTKAACVAALGSRVPEAATVEVEFKKPVLLPTKVAFGSRIVDGGMDFSLTNPKNGKPHVVGRLRQA